jgi:hypothetical protein
VPLPSHLGSDILPVGTSIGHPLEGLDLPSRRNIHGSSAAGPPIFLKVIGLFIVFVAGLAFYRFADRQSVEAGKPPTPVRFIGTDSSALGFAPTIESKKAPPGAAPEGSAGGIARNPKGPDTPFDPAEPNERKKTHRGGSFLCTDQYCSRYMVGTRGKGEVSTGTNHLGFRCVKDVSAHPARTGNKGLAG